MGSLGPKEIYLIFYNAACCVGWAYVLAMAVQALVKGIPEDGVSEALAGIFGLKDMENVLTIVQSAALMEIVHAAIGLVRSPVVVTAMQVSSRIFALVAVKYAPTSQGKYCFLIKPSQYIFTPQIECISYITVSSISIRFSAMGCWPYDHFMGFG